MSSDAKWQDSAPVKYALGSIIPGLVILAWWLGARSGSAVVPSFGEVFNVLTHPFDEPPDLNSRSLAFSVMMTLIRLFLGFALAIATAVPLGILAARNHVVEYVFSPIVELARPINPIVLLPIITVLLGVSSIATVVYGQTEAWRHDVPDQVQTAMILILWYGAFFPIYTATIQGVRSVGTAWLETMRLMGADNAQTIRHVILPHTLPFIANGMRIALGTVWLVVIAAEIFPGTRSGLGYMLCTACKTSEYEYTFSAIIVIGAIGLVTNSLLRRFEERTGHWRAVQR
ncbi:MAG: ABC transporter permease [Nitrospirae bacterium]|nr:ABC transporter permease [Nitrospirota bacterium]